MVPGGNPRQKGCGGAATTAAEHIFTHHADFIVVAQEDGAPDKKRAQPNEPVKGTSRQEQT